MSDLASLLVFVQALFPRTVTSHEGQDFDHGREGTQLSQSSRVGPAPSSVDPGAPRCPDTTAGVRGRAGVLALGSS